MTKTVLIRSDKRAIVRIVNPGPKSEAYTSMARAEKLTADQVAEWVIPGKMIRFVDRSPQALIRLEMAARMEEEQELDQEIRNTRFGCTSWSGSTRGNIPWWEREGLAPIRPGMVVS